MLKNTIYLLLLLDITYGFVVNMQIHNNVKSKPTIDIKRRDCIKYMPFFLMPHLFVKTALAEEKSIKELREEAYKIIEIIDSQKDAFDLPIQKDSNSTIINNYSIS